MLVAKDYTFQNYLLVNSDAVWESLSYLTMVHLLHSLHETRRRAGVCSNNNFLLPSNYESIQALQLVNDTSHIVYAIVCVFSQNSNQLAKYCK